MPFHHDPSQNNKSFIAAVVNTGRRCIKKFKKFGSRKQTSDDNEDNSHPSNDNSSSYKKLGHHRWLFGRMKNHRRSSGSVGSISCGATSYLEDSRRASAVTRRSVQTVATYLEDLHVYSHTEEQRRLSSEGTFYS